MRHVEGEVCGEPGCDAAQDPSAGWPAEKPRLLLALIRPDVYDGVPSFAALRASLSMQVYVCSSSTLSNSSTPEKGSQVPVPWARICPSRRPSEVRLISRRRRIVCPGAGEVSMAFS